jgi:hypothetical protein
MSHKGLGEKESPVLQKLRLKVLITIDHSIPERGECGNVNLLADKEKFPLQLGKIPGAFHRAPDETIAIPDLLHPPGGVDIHKAIRKPVGLTKTLIFRIVGKRILVFDNSD